MTSRTCAESPLLTFIREKGLAGPWSTSLKNSLRPRVRDASNRLLHPMRLRSTRSVATDRSQFVEARVFRCTKISLPANKQLRTVERYRRREASASFHCALAARSHRQGAAAELRRHAAQMVRS